MFRDSEAVRAGQEVPASRGLIVGGHLGQVQTSLTGMLGEGGMVPSGGSEGDRPGGGGSPETGRD